MKNSNRKLVKTFNLTSRYTDDLISINDPRFKQFLKDIYPEELVVSETTESSNAVSYLNLLMDISDGDFVCSIFDKRNLFDFHVVNFPDFFGNTPIAPAYDTYISQLIRYSRACHNYDNSSFRHSMPTDETFQQRLFFEKTDLQLYGWISRT